MRVDAPLPPCAPPKPRDRPEEAALYVLTLCAVAGSGKSTALREYAHKWPQPTVYLAFGKSAQLDQEAASSAGGRAAAGRRRARRRNTTTEARPVVTP